MKIGGGSLVIASSLLLAFWSGPSLAFVPRVTPVGARQKALPPLHFKIPQDVPPVVETLDNKNTNWTIGPEPIQDREIFRMPWLAPVKPPKRGWLDRAVMGNDEENQEGMDEEEAKEILEIKVLERELGLGEEGPVLFQSPLGAAGPNGTIANVSWLQQPSIEVLTPPEHDDERIWTYKAPGWTATLAAAFWRRVSPFPLFKSVPKGCVVVASIKGDDLNLVGTEGPSSLAKLFEEPPVGWLEPVSPLMRAAHDPRVKSIILKIGTLSCGYAKLVEFRRHMEYFKASGKSLIAYMDSAAEKEYFLALGCDEIYMPPGGVLRLQGFASAASFLRGVFDNVGLEPTVVRIGDYKSAGDTINRRNSTEAFRLVQWTLLNQTSAFWVNHVAKDLNKTEEEVKALWDTPVSDPMRLAHHKFITASLYVDQIKEMISERFRAKRFLWSFKARPAKLFPMRSFLRCVGKGRKILPGLPGVRVGDIGPTGAITVPELNDLLEQVQEDSRIKAVVLRIDSPGGDALTSELIWRRILKLRSVKPVIASMVDVAASGGYFLAMGCNAIVAEKTTITGSIGVVAILFKLKNLFEKVGINEEQFAIGKFAKFFLPGHALSEEEREYFEKDVYSSYTEFVQKAGFCRRMTWEQINAVAQGRVWKGEDAKRLGLVDEHGGVWRAIEMAKRLAKIPDKRGITVQTVRGQKKLFGSRNDDELEASVSLTSVDPLRIGRPLALADDVIGDYMRCIGASLPGQRAWTQGLGLGLLGTLALQDLCGPLFEGLLSTQLKQYISRK